MADAENNIGSVGLIPKNYPNSSLNYEKVLKAEENDSNMLNASTIDEPVVETLLRDVKMVRDKLKYVLKPSFKEKRTLRNWDLWGPLIFCLALALTLAEKSDHDAHLIFACIFVLIGVGALLVTLNAQLLGSKMTFFQGICVLGYCVFPLNIGALISLVLQAILPATLKIALHVACLTWASLSSMAFMNTLVSGEKKMISSYPIILFYLFLTWFCVAV